MKDPDRLYSPLFTRECVQAVISILKCFETVGVISFAFKRLNLGSWNPLLSSLCKLNDIYSDPLGRSQAPSAPDSTSLCSVERAKSSLFMGDSVSIEIMAATAQKCLHGNRAREEISGPGQTRSDHVNPSLPYGFMMCHEFTGIKCAWKPGARRHVFFTMYTCSLWMLPKW